MLLRTSWLHANCPSNQQLSFLIIAVHGCGSKQSRCLPGSFISNLDTCQTVNSIATHPKQVLSSLLSFSSPCCLLIGRPTFSVAASLWAKTFFCLADMALINETPIPGNQRHPSPNIQPGPCPLQIRGPHLPNSHRAPPATFQPADPEGMFGVQRGRPPIC